MKDSYSVGGRVAIFPQAGGWHYVVVPKKYTEITKPLADRGLVAVTATLGKSSWNTSLLPMGDGTQFIALPAKIRKAENVSLGQNIKLTFVLRER